MAHPGALAVHLFFSFHPMQKGCNVAVLWWGLGVHLFGQACPYDSSFKWPSSCMRIGFKPGHWGSGPFRTLRMRASECLGFRVLNLGLEKRLTGFRLWPHAKGTDISSCHSACVVTLCWPTQNPYSPYSKPDSPIEHS